MQAGDCKQIVPLSFGKAMVLVVVLLVAFKVMLLVLLPRFRALNGSVVEPKTIPEAPGRILEFMATLLRLLRLVLAPWTGKIAFMVMLPGTDVSMLMLAPGVRLARV